MLVLIESPYFKIVTVSDALTSELLDICLRENFEELHHYSVLTKDQYKVFVGSQATGYQLGLNDKEYVECFSDWIDAVSNCGVSVEATKEFYELFDEALKDHV